MAIPVVERTDTFEEWRIKTNQIAATSGDATQLLTTEKTLVGAINEVKIANDNEFSIAMTIALG